MLTLGGEDWDGDIKDIWMLKEATDSWSVIGTLNRMSKCNAAILIKDQVFVWSGDGSFENNAENINEDLLVRKRYLERLEWKGENMTSSVIRVDNHFAWSPILIDAPADFCIA